MSFWNGTRWIADEPAREGPRRKKRAADWIATILMVALVPALLIVMASAALGAKPDSGCAVSTATAGVGETYVVSAWGLPTNGAINLWVTADGVTTGTPLGGSPDGTFNLNEWSTSPGVTTYAFSGPTRPNNMKVYAECSVSAY